MWLGSITVAAAGRAGCEAGALTRCGLDAEPDLPEVYTYVPATATPAFQTILACAGLVAELWQREQPYVVWEYEVRASAFSVKEHLAHWLEFLCERRTLGPWPIHLQSARSLTFHIELLVPQLFLIFFCSSLFFASLVVSVLDSAQSAIWLLL